MPFLHSLSQWRCRRPLVGLSSLKRSIAMTSTTASGHVDGTTSLSSISPSQSRSSKPFTIGILRETYDQWERRAPLTPEQCRDFLQQQQCGGHGNDNSNVVQRRIIVQPSSRRIFSDQQYIDAGAFVQESLHDADLVLGYV
jgi:alpha-aminoadipic semialdehyde synthase